MSVVTKMQLSCEALEKAMGMPEGVKIARVDMGIENNAIYIWLASETEPEAISVESISDLGMAFLPKDQIPVKMLYNEKGHTRGCTDETCNCADLLHPCDCVCEM